MSLYIPHYDIVVSIFFSIVVVSMLFSIIPIYNPSSDSVVSSALSVQRLELRGSLQPPLPKVQQSVGTKYIGFRV